VRPVIFVRAGSVPGCKDGITRVTGQITRINETPDSLLLCTIDLMSTPSGVENPDVGERCVKGTIAGLAEGALVVDFGAEDVGDCLDADTII